MFAGAAREVVFSHPEVIRRVNEAFVPVALKAAMVNNPPDGSEGALLAEIGRSRPAPQGICTANSSGKVLAWVLSFDDDNSILGFLDHVVERYQQTSASGQPVVAERYRKFPSRKLADVADNGRLLQVPRHHGRDDPCPAKTVLPPGTLVGRIVGRPLDDEGKPIADTTRQEHYMEARLEIPVQQQEQFAMALRQAGEQRFQLPDGFVRALVAPAYLGQLDVHPLGEVPGSRNDHRAWQFWGQRMPSHDTDIVRVRIEGKSNVVGRQEDRGGRSDGRLWEHHVRLDWQGYVDLRQAKIARMYIVANGGERLRWGSQRWNLLGEVDAEHLMAGHPIDLDCAVRYGLVAEPCPDTETETE